MISISTKRFNLFYFLIVATLGYIFGLYIRYTKILDDESSKKNDVYGIDKCYKYKKVERECQ